MTDQAADPLQVWRLDTPCQTLVLASAARDLPAIIYWGAPLSPSEDLAAFARSRVRPLMHGTLDFPHKGSLCPEEGWGWPGQPGLQVVDREGRPVLTQLRLKDVSRQDQSLTVVAEDREGRFVYKALLTAHGSGIVEVSAGLEAKPGFEGRVLWLTAPMLPLPDEADHAIDYAGRWTQEFSPQTVPLQRGVHWRENRRGRTGHDHVPCLTFPLHGAGFTHGEAAAVFFSGPGLHRLFIEEVPDGRRFIQAGLPEAQPLGEGRKAVSGSLLLNWSEEGRNGLAHRFASYVRARLKASGASPKPRPVHYNSWEAVYFRHDIEELKDLANRAAALGAERFVLDDGWFGRRDDDTSSLGDWSVDARKYPYGLTPLIEHVESLGMSFGLWVEPEMVNRDSELARRHPDWIMQVPGLDPLTGRGQMVLDLSRDEVCDYLFDRLDALLASHRIAYLKWDMNRDLTHALDRQGQPLLRRQGEALMGLVARLKSRHPEVDIEFCASGGGRIDLNNFGLSHRIWLSDCNDAHERWLMQAEAMAFLPPEVIGSHVGPRHCHTTGRILPMSFRALVALSGHMGFEMDLRELTEEEAATLRRWTASFKANRFWIHTGRQHRLDAPRHDQVSMMFVDEAQTRFMLLAGQMAVSKAETTAPLRLTGLKEDARYRLRLVNTEDIKPMATRAFRSPLLEADGLVLDGRTLMKAGLVLPAAFPDTIWLVEGQEWETR